jgi:hypothetical protein
LRTADRGGTLQDMRGALALSLLLACGPAVSTAPLAFDEDLGPRGKPAAATADDGAEPQAPRAIAPAGRGVRTGSLTRAQLTAVLDAGPAPFLQQLEVNAKLAGDRFVGWELVQVLDRRSALATLDLAPGDVLLAINGKPVAKPDQFSALWESLRTAPAIEALLWRGKDQFKIRFTVTDTSPIADATTP